MTTKVIDCTTENNVYDPTGPQGQSFQHRWGPRQCPDLELDLSQALDVARGHEHVILKCTYGDPFCWKYFEDFVALCQSPIMIHTTGNVDPEYFKVVAEKFSHVIFSLDGIEDQCGRIMLGADWSKISQNIKQMGKNCTVEMKVYVHNCRQIEQIKNLADRQGFNTVFRPGDSNDVFGTAIIDQNCNWLYDVIPADPDSLTNCNTDTTLRKHLWSYTSLKTYMPAKKHRGLMSHPMISRANYMQEIEHLFEKSYQAQEGIYIAPSGKIFSNSHKYSVYMLLLADDWKLDDAYLRKNRNNRLVQETAYFARRLQQEYT